MQFFAYVLLSVSLALHGSVDAAPMPAPSPGLGRRMISEDNPATAIISARQFKMTHPAVGQDPESVHQRRGVKVHAHATGPARRGLFDDDESTTISTTSTSVASESASVSASSTSAASEITPSATSSESFDFLGLSSSVDSSSSSAAPTASEAALQGRNGDFFLFDILGHNDTSSVSPPSSSSGAPSSTPASSASFAASTISNGILGARREANSPMVQLPLPVASSSSVGPSSTDEMSSTAATPSSSAAGVPAPSPPSLGARREESSPKVPIPVAPSRRDIDAVSVKTAVLGDKQKRFTPDYSSSSPPSSQQPAEASNSAANPEGTMTSEGKRSVAQYNTQDLQNASTSGVGANAHLGSRHVVVGETPTPMANPMESRGQEEDEVYYQVGDAWKRSTSV